MFFHIKHQFEAIELSLPINYRSSEVILEAANRFMQFGGKIEGNSKKGNKILVKNHYDPFIEAEYLVERIGNLHKQGLDYGEIAVFYRVQKQADILQKVFERSEIPFSFTNTGKEEGVLSFMTLHASKGLEFDYVFMIGLNQGLVPLRCSNMEQEEEEMRLFFVGLTRARDNLELSYYTNPTIPGVFETPSRYLQRLPEHLLEWEEKPGSDARKQNLQKLRRQVGATIKEQAAPKEEPEVRKGRHPKYGEGIILSEDDMMIELEFPGYGRKQFMKAFGEVELLGARHP